MGKSLVCCQSAAGRWSQDLSADVILRCTLPTSTLLYTLHSSLPCIHSSSSSNNPEKQLGRHYQNNHIFNPSGKGGPEQWSVLPMVAWEELVVKGLPERQSRWKGGSYQAELVWKPGLLACSPKGSSGCHCRILPQHPPLPLPSSLDIWSPFLHPSIYGLLHFLSGFQGAVYKVTEQ